MKRVLTSANSHLDTKTFNQKDGENPSSKTETRETLIPETKAHNC